MEDSERLYDIVIVTRQAEEALAQFKAKNGHRHNYQHAGITETTGLGKRKVGSTCGEKNNTSRCLEVPDCGWGVEVSTVSA